MSEWKDCIDEPSEVGKKVLCNRNGDIYVAVRFGDYYFPFPFISHYFAPDLVNPDTWSEISFPNGLTGYFRIAPDGLSGKIIKWSEAMISHPKEYEEFTNSLLKNLGSIPRPMDVGPYPDIS